MLITSIFAIGYRCNTDQFMDQYLKVRKYSSPFSYMIIDIDTSLHFIKNKFAKYTDLSSLLHVPVDKHNYTFNKKAVQLQLYINKRTNKHLLENTNVDILAYSNVCVWNYHDMADPKVQESFYRRSKHLVKELNTTPQTMLLYYIEKLQKFTTMEAKYFDIDRLKDFACNFLIVIPLENFPADPCVHIKTSHITVIYFKGSSKSWSVCMDDTTNDWEKLKKLILSLYDFKIDTRDAVD